MLIPSRIDGSVGGRGGRGRGEGGREGGREGGMEGGREGGRAERGSGCLNYRLVVIIIMTITCTVQPFKRGSVGRGLA